MRCVWRCLSLNILGGKMQFGMMNGYGYGMMSGGYWIFGLIFWILVIIGLVLLIKYLWGGGGSKRGEDQRSKSLRKSTPGRSGIEKFLLGSVADKVIRGSR